MSPKALKAYPSYFVLLDILKNKGAITDTELFEALKEEGVDLSIMELNKLLMSLEISGKIQVTSSARRKKRIELRA
jgi:Ca2+-binding EF-hand superfamily protein